MITPAIPASQIVNVIPGVLGPGGTGVDLNTLCLTQSTRVPIGEVVSFPSAAAVADWFGQNAPEAAFGSIYFKGPLDPTGVMVQPGEMLFAQYNTAPVPAYMQGGSIGSAGLAAIQAVNGTLSITIDGSAHSGSVNLSGATSFSNAAQIIADALDITSNPVVAVVTGSITTTVLTVTAVLSGTLAVGTVLTGAGVTAGTYISAILTGSGGIGTYTVSASQTVASTTVTATLPAAIFTGTISTTTLTVSAVANGTLAVGQIIAGAGVTAGTYISAILTGSGGIGTYTISVSQTVGSSTAMTSYVPGVSYDSVSGALIVVSATTGTGSTMAFAAAGTPATVLALTAARGAFLSQGAAANTTGTGAQLVFMNNIVNSVTQDWATFFTAWEPPTADKISFSQWDDSTDDRYVYLMWDTSAQNVTVGGPSAAVAAIQAANYSGTVFLYSNPSVDTIGGEVAALAASWAASLDFDHTNGRVPLAFVSQTGLPAQVLDATEANFLNGYGVSFYGDYNTAKQSFNWVYGGEITGPFLWADSYVNQIWLNSLIQLALMELLGNVRFVPYNTTGRALIETTLVGSTSSTTNADGTTNAPGPISQALNFGMIQPGITLSGEEAAAVNQATGKQVDTVLSTRGWYLDIQPASPQTRVARGSPPMALYYTDGQSMQKMVINSVEVQ